MMPYSSSDVPQEGTGPFKVSVVPQWPVPLGLDWDTFMFDRYDTGPIMPDTKKSAEIKCRPRTATTTTNKCTMPLLRQQSFFYTIFGTDLSPA